MKCPFCGSEIVESASHPNYLFCHNKCPILYINPETSQVISYWMGHGEVKEEQMDPLLLMMIKAQIENRRE